MCLVFWNISLFDIYFITGEKAPCYSSVKLLEDSLKTDLRCKDFDNWSYGIDNVDGSAVIRHFGIKLSQDSDSNKWCSFHLPYNRLNTTNSKITWI